jgi:hypothetical protein
MIAGILSCPVIMILASAKAVIMDCADHDRAGGSVGPGLLEGRDALLERGSAVREGFGALLERRDELLGHGGLGLERVRLLRTEPEPAHGPPQRSSPSSENDQRDHQQD